MQHLHSDNWQPRTSDALGWSALDTSGRRGGDRHRGTPHTSSVDRLLRGAHECPPQSVYPLSSTG